MSKVKLIEPGDVVSDADVLWIYNGIKDRSLPKAAWTHGGHLCGAVGILCDIGLERAEHTMPDLIRRYNEATGVQNTESDGYHHTVTLFYLRAINRFLTRKMEQSIGEIAIAVLASSIADKAFLQKYYSHERLFSVEARKNWVEPDILALDI